MFILQIAQVVGLLSWPYSAMFAASWPVSSKYCFDWISIPPEPHVGSYTNMPACGLMRRTMSRTTHAGV